MQEAKKYELLRILLAVSAVIVELGFFGTLYFSGFSYWLSSAFESIIAPNMIRVFGFVFVVITGAELITFPLNLWRGWILPRRFSISRQSFRQWFMEYIKTTGLSMLLVIIVSELFYAFLSIAPSWWWFLFSLAMIIALAVVTKFLPLIILPLFIRARPLEDEELTSSLEDLLRNVLGARAPIYIMDISDRTHGATAMIAGMGSTTRIYLADTLLRQFTPDEIRVITAHELGHHHYKHLWRALAAQGAVFFITALIMHLAFPYTALRNLAFYPLVIVLAGIYFVVLMYPIIWKLKTWELEADQFAVQITGLREPFITALERLSSLNRIDMEPSSLIESIFHTHPSIKKRIAFIRSLALNDTSEHSAGGELTSGNNDKREN